jgi:hypothetical protein
MSFFFVLWCWGWNPGPYTFSSTELYSSPSTGRFLKTGESFAPTESLGGSALRGTDARFRCWGTWRKLTELCRMSGN